MSAAEQAIPIQQPGGPARGYWMRRQKSHCARQAGHPGQHGVRPDPGRVLIDGIWIEHERYRVQVDEYLTWSAARAA